MILFVGKKIRFGQFVEVVKNDLHDQFLFVDENFDIRKQENEILLACERPKFVVYDIEQYQNYPADIIDIIMRVYRANKATPILYVPSTNRNNEIVKAARDSQLNLFISSATSMSEQKDKFTKCVAGFYEGNKDEEISEADEALAEENGNLKEYVQQLHEAKQREEEKENTVIVKKKGTAEVLLNAASKVFKTIICIICFILAAIGVITLIYPNVRTEFFQVAINVWNEILSMISRV